MLEKIEFYNCPDGSVIVKPFDKPMFVYEQSCRKITEEMLIVIRDLYPTAFSALAELYSRSERNRDYYEYRIVHRFIRCNFGEYDALTFDISQTGDFYFEDVRCPMRGECLFEGVICKPALKTELTPRETEVAKMLSSGLSVQDISENLQISILTVRNHVQHIKARLRLKHTSQIISKFK